MAALDHWHPVLPARQLSTKHPVGITLANQRIALFRSNQGTIGAVNDCCVHRRASLCRGRVVDGRLQCGYHGWLFSADGEAESPGTPKMRATTTSYDTVEKYGYVWLRARGSQAKLPQFNTDGYEYVCTLDQAVDAPLELVLDNFTEVEHTPTTHANFGYELSRMSEVQTHVESTDASVRVVNVGPQKRTPWIIQALAGLRSGDRFTDDWTTYFSPVYSVYDQFWNDPKTGIERRDRWRIYVFFNPLEPGRTQLVVFAYLRATTPARAAFIRATRPLLKRIVNVEVQCDVAMLESLADKNPSIEGMKLSRFDRVLGMQRERINRIYYGKPQACSADAASMAETI